jgi:hypothetical protein
LLESTGHTYRTIKRNTAVAEQMVVSLVGPMVAGNVCVFYNLSLREKLDIFKRFLSLSHIKGQRILSLNMLISHEERPEGL